MKFRGLRRKQEGLSAQKNAGRIETQKYAEKFAGLEECKKV